MNIIEEVFECAESQSGKHAAGEGSLKKTAHRKADQEHDDREHHPDVMEMWRVHRRHRIGQFSPGDAKGCPVIPSAFTMEEKHGDGRGRWHAEGCDRPGGKGNASKDMGARWTGVTKFKLKDESRPAPSG